MKRIFIIFLILLPNLIYSQSSVTKDIVKAREELYVRDTNLIDLIEEHTSGSSVGASNMLNKSGSDIKFGGTATENTSISGVGYDLTIGTALSKLGAYGVNSNSYSVTSDNNITLTANGTSYVWNGTYWISGSDTLLTSSEADTKILNALPYLPFNFEYIYNSTITDSRPNPTFFRLNNADLSLVTQIYIDYFDFNSVDKNKFLSLPDTGAFISIITDVNNYAIYQLTGGVIDGGNYYKYGVTYSGHSGTIAGKTTIDFEFNSNTASGGGGGGGFTDKIISSTDTLSISNDSLSGDSLTASFRKTESDTFKVRGDRDYNIYEQFNELWIVNDVNNYGVNIGVDDRFKFVDGLFNGYDGGSTVMMQLKPSDNQQGSVAYRFRAFSSKIIAAVNDVNSEVFVIHQDSVVSEIPIKTDTVIVSNQLTASKATIDSLTSNAITLNGTTLDTVKTLSDAIEAEPNIDSIGIGNKTIKYDAANGVHEFETAISGVNAKVSLIDLVPVYNNSGVTIPKAKPVRYTGSVDTLNTIARVGALDTLFGYFAGMTAHEIPNNTWGYIYWRGVIPDVDMTGLALASPIYLGVDSNLTTTKPAPPANVLLLGGVQKAGVNGRFYINWSFAFQRQINTKSYNFTSQSITAGTYYRAGFYESSATDANLSQASLTVNYGTANIAKSAHPFIVCGGAGTVNSGAMGVEVEGTYVDDMGNRIVGHKDTIIRDITSVALDEYYEAAKFSGTVIYRLIVMSGTPTTYSFDFNYGYAKYEDIGNRNFYVSGVEVLGLAGANDASFNIKLLHHKSTGWTYAATGFEPGSDSIYEWSTDLGTEDNLANDENSSWKRVGTYTFIEGADSEGVLFQIEAGASSSAQSFDLHLTGTLD